MRSYDDLERLYETGTPEALGRGAVHLICLRLGDGEHACPPEVAVTVAGGLAGDRWAAGATPDPECQVTLMSVRVAGLIAGDDIPLHLAGDNFLVDLDLSEAALPVGARVRLGTALLEVSAKPHTGCKKFNMRYGVEALQFINHRSHRPLRLRGVNCRVIEDGRVAVGDAVVVQWPDSAT